MVESAMKPKAAKSDFPAGLPGSARAATEWPSAMSEFFQTGFAQAKDAQDRMLEWGNDVQGRLVAAAEQASEAWGEIFTATAKGTADWQRKMVEIGRANVDAAFDLVGDLAAAKSPWEVVERSTAHTRKQIDAAAVQLKELSALAQKVATEATEPIKTSVFDTLKRAA